MAQQITQEHREYCKSYLSKQGLPQAEIEQLDMAVRKRMLSAYRVNKKRLLDSRAKRRVSVSLSREAYEMLVAHSSKSGMTFSQSVVSKFSDGGH